MRPSLVWHPSKISSFAVTASAGAALAATVPAATTVIAVRRVNVLRMACLSILVPHFLWSGLSYARRTALRRPAGTPSHDGIRR
ncbi:hypothetical protein Nm8I071_36660 [Nonomuraea sp. TT08I-71]|nr:hypothetical protein Nm8I071_36660 [Nonomuraea sp. TT08I-71]